MIDDRDLRKSQFPVLQRIQTRWQDEDAYGHVNNVQYYSYFDTVVNRWLMQETGTDIRKLDAIGVVAQTSCRFLDSLSFPGDVVAGIALERLGNRSIVYRIALFAQDPALPTDPAGDEPPVALGRFVHVYVDAVTRRPVPIPDVVETAVLALVR